MTGSVAIHPKGARLRPTRRLMAMKATLLVRKRPWHRASSQRFRFMVCPVYGAKKNQPARDWFFGTATAVAVLLRSRQAAARAVAALRGAAAFLAKTFFAAGAAAFLAGAFLVAAGFAAAA